MRKTILIAGIAICIICAALISYGLFTQRDAIPSRDLTLSDYPELFAKEAVIVIGDNASLIENESAEAIAANLEILTGNKPEICNTKKIESFKYSYNLVIVGTPKSNKILEEVCNMTDAIRVTDEYPGENKGVLEILGNPWNEDKAMLLVEGSDGRGVKASVARLEEGQELNKSSIVVEWEEITLPDIMAAPKQIFIYVGEKEEFSFWTHNITVNYVSSSPEQVLNVIVDGDEKVVKIDPTIECPNHHCGYYWQSENLDFSVRPITWEINEDTNEKIWSYSETWNTTDLHFKVSIIKSF